MIMKAYTTKTKDKNFNLTSILWIDAPEVNETIPDEILELKSFRLVATSHENESYTAFKLRARKVVESKDRKLARKRRYNQKRGHSIQ